MIKQAIILAEANAPPAMVLTESLISGGISYLVQSLSEASPACGPMVPDEVVLLYEVGTGETSSAASLSSHFRARSVASVCANLLRCSRTCIWLQIRRRPAAWRWRESPRWCRRIAGPYSLRNKQAALFHRHSHLWQVAT